MNSRALLFLLVVVLSRLSFSAGLNTSSTTRIDTRDQAWLAQFDPLFGKDVTADDPLAFYRELTHQMGNGAESSPSQTQARYLQLQLAGLQYRKVLTESLDTSTTGLAAWVNARPSLFPQEDRVDLLSIYIRRYAGEGKERALARAMAARRMLKEGIPFQEVAMRTSDARSAGFGGSAGTIRRNQIDPATEAIVFQLAAGETTGPIEREHGYHIFQVASRHQAFNFEKPEDREHAKRLWQEYQLGLVFEKLVGSWQKANSPVVKHEPVNISNWVEESWITYGQARTEPFSLVYHNVAASDFATSSPGEWSPFWEEEASVYSRLAMMNIASLEQIGESAELSRTLSLALEVQKGINGLRAWYADLEPTEQQVQEYFNAHVDRLVRPKKLYTLLFWEVPFRSDVMSSSTVEKRAQINNLLSEVYTHVQHFAPKTEKIATTLLDSLGTKFEGAKWRKYSKTDSLSPFIDPILQRTDEGTLSLPFDNESGVGLVYMIEIEEKQSTLEDVRAVVREEWRRMQLNEKVSAIRSGIMPR